MFGRARNSPRPYFVDARRPSRPSIDVTTLKSVDHSAFDGIVTSNVIPCSSMCAPPPAEIAVSRRNVSRS